MRFIPNIQCLSNDFLNMLAIMGHINIYRMTIEKKYIYIYNYEIQAYLNYHSVYSIVCHLSQFPINSKASLAS